MLSVIRQHLPPSQAHILAGVLSSSGIDAHVWGDQAAHIYGEMVTGGCSVAIDEQHREDAEALLGCTDFADEPSAADSDAPAETCPPNGDLPGVGTILYGSLRLAPLAVLIPTALYGIHVFATYDVSLGQMLRAMASAYLQSLLALAICLPLYATGAGLLLLLIPAYRRGEPVFGLIAKAIALLLILATLLQST